MSVLFFTNDRCQDHEIAPGHPERPDRLTAVMAGVAEADLGEALVHHEATAAPVDAINAVHDSSVHDIVARLSADGGGQIDADTGVNAASYDAALIAAGAGLEAVERLRNGEGDAAFCAVRPPGHHATDKVSMGFCLFNNVAVTAQALADAGERVVIVDYDAHHGNGTQDIFYGDPRVLFVSFHQHPCYPGTGRADETGIGDGVGTTVNFPMPIGATGDVYRRAWNDVAMPIVDSFEPTWLLLSAGFDAHRRDPITSLGLTAGDYADLTPEICSVVPAGRRVAFLEGGYDLDALTWSSAACLAALVGEEHRVEASSNGGPGTEVLDLVAAAHRSE